MPYAEGTSVPVSKPRIDLDELLRAHGADNIGVAIGTGYVRLMFTMEQRTISFHVGLPTGAERDITHTPQGRIRSAPARHTALDAEHRRRWRALLLVLKAKLESAESGIETLESAFLANIVLPGGETVLENVAPAIAAAYTDGQVRPLLALNR